MSTSGFLEIQGGNQPGIPGSGRGRLWFDTSDNFFKVLLPDGRNLKITDIQSEQELSSISSNDLLLVYNTATSSFRRIKIENLNPNPLDFYEEVDHFVSGSSAGILNWTITNANAGSGAAVISETDPIVNKTFGVVRISTGTTNSGRTTIHRNVNNFHFGSYSIEQEWRIQLPDLSNASNRYIATFGFIDNIGAGAHVDGAYFSYSDNASTGEWECITANNSSYTVMSSGVPANTSYNVFKIRINQAANEVRFFINNNLVSTITTNIPTNVSRATGIGAKIEKTIGTTNRDLRIDYFKQKVIW